MLNKIHHGDCLKLMKDIPDKSIDMILCDLPYGTTSCKWDTIIPFEPLWEQYERIIKDNGAIVLTGSQPFTSALIMSNPKLFRYEWIWKKSHGSFANAKVMPLKRHESILVFSKGTTVYNRQMTKVKGKIRDRRTEKSYLSGNKTSPETSATNPGIKFNFAHDYDPSLKNPQSIIEFPNAPGGRLHPTQKPVALFEYLIKTYTNEGETVLDNCIGSGTTAIAALNTGRLFIGIEQEKEYVDIANKRIEEHKMQLV